MLKEALVPQSSATPREDFSELAIGRIGMKKGWGESASI